MNLKDCPPFGSLYRCDLSLTDKVSFESLCAQASAAEQAQRPAQATEKYREAAKLDDRFAELHFKLARCLEVSGQLDQARHHYSLARDLDTIQFRTDSSLNQVVRQVAAAHQSRGVQLVDIEQTFQQEASSAKAIVGQQFFHEHVHLNFDGNYALARALLPTLQSSLPDAVRQGATGPAPVLTRDRSAQLLAFTPLAELRMAEPMAAIHTTPPFLNQFDNAQRQTAVKLWLDAVRSRADAADLGQLARLHQAAIAKAPDDWYLHDSYGQLLVMQDDTDGATAHLQKALKFAPHHRQTLWALGQVLLRQGKAEQAVAHYRAMLADKPDLFQARKGLADALASQRQFDQALEQYQQLLTLSPGNLSVSSAIVDVLVGQGKFDAAVAQTRSSLAKQPILLHTALASLRYRQGKLDIAIDHFRQALALAPADVDLRVQFATMLFSAGKPRHAAELCQEALRLDPRHVAALNSMGSALVAMGKFDQAADCYRRVLNIKPNFTANFELGNRAVALRDLVLAEDYYSKAIALEPRNAAARHNIGSVLLVSKKLDAAVEQLTAAVKIDPQYASAHHLLGQALKRQGKTALAAQSLRRALELKDDSPELLAAMAWIMATAQDDKLRNAPQAVTLAEQAAEKTLYKSWQILDVLAAAYAESGRFKQAHHTATVAAQLACSEGNEPRAKAIRARAELYRSHQPCREP